ncbi:phosphotransferase [Actinoplanes sp. ATCC 53533]|uniref:phosphotransferase n=1 Tax=Actinoplanes sp. ATCC 53533 TaxID=1288362 RepID=UPI000F77BDA4|nr:phosphotransferase [Actinoplanes sp. ATCC 53533]
MQVTPSVPDRPLAGDDVFEHLPGFQLGERLRATDKAVTVAGRWRGEEVVAKQLTSTDRHWVKRFAHEVTAYQVFAASPPPWRTPRLHYAAQRLLVIQRLPGAPPHTDRYPPRLPEATVTGMIDALAAFAAWQPPAGPLRKPATDLPARIRRYTAAGDLPVDDQHTLVAAVTAAPAQFGHGDPLPSNALSTGNDPLIFIDFEFVGFYPGGADLALLGLWLGRHDPAAEQRCAQTAAAAGHLHSYRAMRVLWVAREQRLYHGLFDTAGDHRQWLGVQATAAIAAFRETARA